MKVKEYEEILGKMAEQINASLMSQVDLLKEQNEHLKEVIKLQDKQIDNLLNGMVSFFNIGNDEKEKSSTDINIAK